MNPIQCKHFNGIQNSTCPRGHRYVSMPHPLPCFGGTSRAGCPDFETPSSADLAADEAEMAEAIRAYVLLDGWRRVAQGYGLAARHHFSAGLPIKPWTFSTMGVRGTTWIHVRRDGGMYEARCGVMLMGYAHNRDMDADPFAEDFPDMTIVGRGRDEDAALDDLRREGMAAADRLFA